MCFNWVYPFPCRSPYLEKNHKSDIPNNTVRHWLLTPALGTNPLNTSTCLSPTFIRASANPDLSILLLCALPAP